jgi:hypothetical protein
MNITKARESQSAELAYWESPGQTSSRKMDLCPSCSRNLKIWAAFGQLSNVFAEIFSRYEAPDYKDIFEEYERKKAKRMGPMHTLLLDT